LILLAGRFCVSGHGRLLRPQRGRDLSIQTYRSKRNFSRTSEPAPRKAASSPRAALKFVVQKHAARHLHWDFRL
jgi:hypothetical protein